MISTSWPLSRTAGLPDKCYFQPQSALPVVHHGFHTDLSPRRVRDQSAEPVVSPTQQGDASPEFQLSPIPRHLSPHREIEQFPMISSTTSTPDLLHGTARSFPVFPVGLPLFLWRPSLSGLSLASALAGNPRGGSGTGAPLGNLCHQPSCRTPEERSENQLACITLLPFQCPFFFSFIRNHRRKRVVTRGFSL